MSPPSQSTRRSNSKIGTAAGLWLAAVFLAGCTNTFVEPLPKQNSAVDDKLTLSGTVCTEAPDPRNFPVKVVFIIDQSGSMCVSDPPGSQQGQTGLCEAFCNQPGIQANLALVPGCATNSPTPGRVQALLSIVDEFRKQNAPYGNNGPVQVAMVPFETNVAKSTWPPQGGFQQPDGPGGSADTFVQNLQSQLGNGTDYQGVLDYARDLITTDILATNQETLPKTRYVIVFLTDGTPYPRCTVNPSPALGTNYANNDPFNHPELTWDDDPRTYCESATGSKTDPREIAGYLKGTDRNQNYQLFDIVDHIMSLKDQYNIGDINFDTILLLNPRAVELCGLICQDLYGSYPGLSATTFSQATFSVASWLLSEMSRRGNGIFQAFTNGQITNLSLGGLDYTSFASSNVMKSFFVQAQRTIPSPTGRVFDSDGDGLPDSLDNQFTNGTSQFVADSDNDCFNDDYELVHKAEGFNPAVPDPRGCLPNGGCVCADTDGDGLSQYEEAYLGTNPGIMDSDHDGLPDGVEVRYGFNPTHHDNFSLQDTDGDGVSDLQEIMANTDPTTPDSALYATDGYQYSLKANLQKDGSICYDYQVSNLRMLPTPAQTGQRDGYNLYKLYFDFAPASILDKDYGIWQTSCAWGEYAPPELRTPLGPVLEMTKANWLRPQNLVTSTDYLTKCAGVAP